MPWARSRSRRRPNLPMGKQWLGGGVVGVVSQGERSQGGGGGRSIGPVEVSVSVLAQALVHKL